VSPTDDYLLLAFTRCNAPGTVAEWSDWYDDIHLPHFLEAGADVITRFELTQKPVPGMPSIGFSHVALYEFRGDRAEARLDATLKQDDALRTSGDVHPHHCVISVDVLRAHGGRKSDPSPALQGHIMAYVMSNQIAREPEWDAWYDEQHLPDMMASGAFSAGSRWLRRTPSSYGANHMTLYDVEGHSVEESVTLSAAVMPGIAAAGRKLSCHVGALTVTLRPTGRHGGAGLRK
jgi:hypothetical protein